MSTDATNLAIARIEKHYDRQLMVCARCADRGQVSQKIGMDLVSVADVRDALDASGDRYLNRIYSAREVADCRRAGSVDASRLAMRFAAKEAVMKILSPDDHDAVPWNSIEVGASTVSLVGGAAALAAQRGVGSMSLSYTHAGDHVAAVALAQIGAQA